MTLRDAKTLRDEITAKTGAYCIVPLGFKPDRYFCRIFRSVDGPAVPVDFHSRQAWLLDVEDQQRLKREREHARRPLSPIEMMIDKATGYDKTYR